jgi:hypothetical protein
MRQREREDDGILCKRAAPFLDKSDFESLSDDLVENESEKPAKKKR